jgi:hypothetical protein
MRRLLSVLTAGFALVTAPAVASAGTLTATILTAPDASSALHVAASVPSHWRGSVSGSAITFRGAGRTISLAPIRSGGAVARGVTTVLTELGLAAKAKRACGRALVAKKRAGRGWFATAVTCRGKLAYATVGTASDADLGGAELLLGSTVRPSGASATALGTILRTLKLDFVVTRQQRPPSVDFLNLRTTLLDNPGERIAEIGTVVYDGDAVAIQAYYDLGAARSWVLAGTTYGGEKLVSVSVGGKDYSLDSTKACFHVQPSTQTTGEAYRSEVGMLALPPLLAGSADVGGGLAASYDVAPVLTGADGSKALSWTSFGLAAAALSSTTVVHGDGSAHVETDVPPYFSFATTLHASLDFTHPTALPDAPVTPTSICP